MKMNKMLGFTHSETWWQKRLRSQKSIDHEALGMYIDGFRHFNVTITGPVPGLTDSISLGRPISITDTILEQRNRRPTGHLGDVKEY